MRWIALAGLLCVSSIASAEVKVTRNPATVETRHFDAAHPPAEMPKLSGNEAAVTVSNFGSEAHVGGEVTDQQANDGKAEVSIKIDSVEIVTRLGIVIWLPNDANPKLAKHEDGHRQIAEHFYQQAESVAQRDAEALIGQVVKGHGTDVSAASDMALKASATALGKLYLQQIDSPCAKAQEAFDQITMHGTNAVPESKAVERAIAKVEK